MERHSCKHCRQIYCHGCIKGFSAGNKHWGLELEMKKAEAKMVYQSFWKKQPSSSSSSNSNSNTQHDRLKGPSPPSVIPLGTPPRGKRAFLCGVTYKKQKFELKGTAHDVKNMRDLLVEQFGFQEESILILAEEEPYIPPTRKNIEDAFEWLVRGVQSGDSLVFYFSGHGLRQRDLDDDELDGFDETICPVDFKASGMILDDYINQAIVRPLIPDVTLHAIVDSCHSGTVLDLPSVYDFNTGTWEDNRPPSGEFKGTSGGKAICFSACEDYQLAADTSALSPDKEMTGAMTSTFIKAIKTAFANNQRITYHGILDSMHHNLRQAHDTKKCIGSRLHRVFQRKILQDPLLSSSEEFSTLTEFKL